MGLIFADPKYKKEDLMKGLETKVPDKKQREYLEGKVFPQGEDGTDPQMTTDSRMTKDQFKKAIEGVKRGYNEPYLEEKVAEIKKQALSEEEEN